MTSAGRAHRIKTLNTRFFWLIEIPCYEEWRSLIVSQTLRYQHIIVEVNIWRLEMHVRLDFVKPSH